MAIVFFYGDDKQRDSKEGRIKEDVLKNEKLNNPSKNCFTIFIHVEYLICHFCLS
jgi:hypothetical protein